MGCRENYEVVDWTELERKSVEGLRNKYNLFEIDIEIVFDRNWYIMDLRFKKIFL